MWTPPRSALFSLLVSSLSSCLVAAEGPHISQREEDQDGRRCISVVNDHCWVQFHTDNGDLTSIWAPLPNGSSGENYNSIMLRAPLWSLELMPKGATKPVTIDATQVKHCTIEPEENGGHAALHLIYDLDAVRVRVRVGLDKNSRQARWHIEAESLREDSPLWSITFPLIPITPPENQAGLNEMLVPYRRGQTRPCGMAAPRGDVELPYPGPSAKFQFMAIYGSQNKRGFYYAAEDGAGYSKTFLIRNHPETAAAIFGLQHFPEGRGAGVRKWSVPYDVVAGPYQGDWWDAAQIYRAWWTKQIWARNGLLADRHDLPDWLLRASLAVRASTTKPERTIPNNETCLTALSEAMGRQPFFGVWYGYPLAPTNAKSLDEGGHGHLLPPKPGLIETLKRLKEKQGIHFEAYIQSMIYDASIPSPDDDAVSHAVTLDGQGRRVPYGSGSAPDLLAMCRATDWWQTRLVDLSKRAVGEYGFDGVYLDSFGKGAPECFAKDHAHPIAGGNTCIVGQRQLAERVRAAIRALNPQAIMSGEDPIEAFRDLLDVNLYSVNVMRNYVPIYRTVWGDYSLGHGRVLAPGRGDGFIPELAVLFLEGTVPGRIYCDSPKPLLLEPSFAKEWAFMKTLDHYTQHGLPYLRMGEYLHPLELTPAPPLIEFTESAEKQKVQMPAVMHSVTRSHADGSVAVVLVNISAENHTITVPIEPALRIVPDARGNEDAVLSRMDEEGNLTKLSAGKNPWMQKAELKPREVVFWVLK